VIVGQNNMSEEGIFENPGMRKTFAELGIAEVWVAPRLDTTFDFVHGAGERFDAMMRALAAESGYSELAFAPAIPIGHSACASYPWNFAAWNPGRTLAAISEHGDAPLTPLTGSGQPNPDWGDRTIDGVPCLMVMGEYEWLEERLAPAIAYRAQHPAAPIALLAEPGRGHFDVSDDLLGFLALFIRKAVAARLPANAPLEGPVPLKPIDPRSGWLVERWHLNQKRTETPAPAAEYRGDPRDAFWYFDGEMAKATQNYRIDQIGRLPQLLGWVQDGKVVPQSATHNQVSLAFEPLPDGLTFRLAATYLDQVGGGSPNLVRWTGLPVGTPLGHASGGGPIQLTRITGPAVQVGPDTFRVQFNRTASTVDNRERDIWLLASQPGDATYKSAVQQAQMRLPAHNSGAGQQIDFPAIADQKIGTSNLKLIATSDAGAPVSFYVREGPAVIRDGMLEFTAIPPRAKWPVKVTVVAWQYGRGGLKAAMPVQRTFAVVP